MNVTPFTSRFIGATIIWIIRKSMSSNGVQIKKKRGGAEKKQNKFIDNVYPRICSIPLQRWSEIIVRMKFHSSANRFVRTCFQPLSILLPSSYSRLPSFPLLSCKSFLFFLYFFLCPVVHDERRPRGNCSWPLERTRRTKVHSEIHPFVAAPR